MDMHMVCRSSAVAARPVGNLYSILGQLGYKKTINLNKQQTVT